MRGNWPPRAYEVIQQKLPTVTNSSYLYPMLWAVLVITVAVVGYAIFRHRGRRL